MAAIPYDVAEAFTQRRKATRGAFHSDGTSLWSYGMCIATWSANHNMICINVDMSNRRSMTTSRHMRAFEVVIETLQSERMPFWQNLHGYRKPKGYIHNG